MLNVAKILLLAVASANSLISADEMIAVQQGETLAASTANPIRRVVSLLQAMAKKVSAEGEAEKELYEKFMCYCQTSGGDLKETITKNEAAIPQLQSDIEASEAEKKTAEEDLKAAQDGRARAKEDIARATAIRKKEAEAFAKVKAELDSYIGALTKAIPAIEKGMAGTGFLQTSLGAVLRRVALADSDLSDFDRQSLTAFLSGGHGQGAQYIPQSGEITGILKQLLDEFSKDLADATAEEEAAIANFKALVGALMKEIAAHTEAIERKTKLIGELGVKIAMMKNSLTDAEQALIEDTKFLKDLDKMCETQTAEWDERIKTRGLELAAIYDTIKLLNDDDALELFKKTLPSPALLQVQTRTTEVRHRAIKVLQEAQKHAHSTDLDLIALALSGKSVDFTKVFKMIDDLLALLKKEQQDDDNKKEYCEMQLDQVEDKIKELGKAIGDLEKGIEDKQETLKTLASDIETLTDGIKALDKQVEEATEIRKKENAEYSELMAADTSAKDLIGLAKNRLNKFYNPKLYKPAPKRELSEEEAISTSVGGAEFLQVARQSKAGKDAPPPPPAKFDAYSKKSEESTGVIAMLDLLVKDLDKEMQEATVDEENAQKSYEQMMADSAEKRADDSKALTDKEKAKADTEVSLEADKEAKVNALTEFQGAGKYEAQLHAECDWLLQNFDLRKEARASEADALKNAKAVLSGADFSFAQGPVQHRALRHVARA